MSYCRKCGVKLRDGDKYCYNCGSSTIDDLNPNKKLFILITTGITLLLAITAVIFILHISTKKPDEPDIDHTDNIKQNTDNLAENTVSSADDLANSNIVKSDENNASVAEQENATTDFNTADETENTAVTTEKLVQDVIDLIETQPGYSENSIWAPLCVVDDFNGDGIQEFLSVYETKEGSLIEVMYDLWSLPETGAVKIKSETLFQEAGGNNGSVGIVKGTDAVYLGIQRSAPTGSASDTSELYYPWNPEKSALDESCVFLQSHEIIDIPGTSSSQGYDYYILGDTKVDKTTFDARKNDFSNWIYKLQFTQGPSDGVLTFDDFK